jgi:hypothetical protein
MTFEKIAYAGWENCYRLANDTIDLVITGDVGPRIIRLGFIGEENEFCEVKEMLGKTGGDEWRIYGGHRFWHSPEDPVRTYYPDNAPVSVQEKAGVVHVVQPVEPTTGMQKELDITLSPDEAKVTVVHRMRNLGIWPVELAPWALSVMTTNGTAIIPFPPRGTHPENLLPANTITLWPFTNMADARWTWGQKYVLLKQQEGNTVPQKVGVMVPDGWAAYARNGHLFVKTFDFDPAATYPDLGCCFETFTNEFMLEVETVGPLTKLEPNGVVEHVETWHLFKGAPVPENDADVEANVLPKIQAAIG